MPNWCYNRLYVQGDSGEFYDKITSDDYKEINILKNIVPIPPEEEGNWYEWCNINWSTKWGDCSTRLVESDDGWLHLVFDSAWAPPIEGIKKVSAAYPNLIFALVYEEGGMSIIGAARFEKGRETVTVDVIHPSEEFEGDISNDDDYERYCDSITAKMDFLVETVKF